jgi:IS5 family transposase
MFKIVLIQQWYSLADDNTEYVINDRLSFQRFLKLTLGDEVPDAKTIWAFKEQLSESGADVELFRLFTGILEQQSLVTGKGSIVNASFVDVLRQRNTRKENETIKSDEVPEGWLSKVNKNMLRQKDKDARWTKKYKETHYRYKGHINVDEESKLIIDFDVTNASVHETEEQKANNKIKSRVNVRVEHIFGHMTNSLGAMYIRCIGISRAILEIAMKNLAYNLQRYNYVTRNLKCASA